MMPNTASQRSGIGMNHQLQVNGRWLDSFMDGASAQVPIVMGTIGDENPDAPYKITNDDDEPFPKQVNMETMILKFMDRIKAQLIVQDQTSQ